MRVFINSLLVVFLLTISAIAQNSNDTTGGQAPASQEQVKSSTQPPPQQQSQQNGLAKGGKLGFNIQTISDLFKTAEEIGYLLIIVFASGILFVMQQLFVLLREKRDAKKIPIEEIKDLDYDGIERMFIRIKENAPLNSEDNSNGKPQKIPLLRRIFRQKKASAYQLLYKLFRVYESKKSTASFNEEISNFIAYLKDMFNPFLTRLIFLSDTAGALGLLGTVWGMFLVFAKGTPDQGEVLSGMGIALATTIIGLVISIILNSLTTVVSNMFDRHLDIITQMANIFQERMMREEKTQPPTPLPVAIPVSSDIATTTVPAGAELPKYKPAPAPVSTDQPEEEKPTVQTPTISFGPPAKIVVLSGEYQNGVVNNPLPEPILIEVQDKNGQPLPDRRVTFIAEDGAGTFSNDDRIQKKLTNEEGQAEAQLVLGKEAGEKAITIVVDNGNHGLETSIFITAKPTPPKQFVEVKGNYQTGEIGKRLQEPFTVAVLDEYDNPIPNYEVLFQLQKGSGKFQDSQNARYTALTNERGIAEAFFVLGKERGAREIEAEAKRVQPAKISFEVFAI